MDNAPVLQTMKILHKALYIGLVIFAAVATYLVASNSASNVIGDFESIMQIIALVFTAIAVFLGEKLFKNKLLIIKEQSDNKVKLELYRQASITQWALLEAAAIISIVGFFLSTNYAFLALTICIIIYFILLSPTEVKTSLLTGISNEELSIL